MDPINYDVGTANPLASFTAGLKGATDMRTSQLEVEAKELALKQKKDAAAVIARLNNPNATAADYAGAAMLLPKEQADSVRESFKVLDASRTQAVLERASGIFSAFKSGQPEIATKLIQEHADALKNSGDLEGAKHAQTWADVAAHDPKAAESYFGFTLAHIPGGDKVIDGANKIGQEARAAAREPHELTKLQADAQSAAVTAKFAESKAVQDMAKTGWDITKIQEDIKIAKENTKIAAQHAAIARESNAIKKQEMSITLQNMKDKREEVIRERVAGAQQGAATIDNMLNTIARVKNNPSLNDVLGSIEGSEHYPNTYLGMLTGNGDERADAIHLIETLSSQAFTSQIPNMKGMGSLSEKEGDKLQTSLQNLSRKQSEKQFRENLNEAERLMNKARENLSIKTGVPLGKPDVPAAPGSRPPIGSFSGQPQPRVGGQVPG